MTRLVTVAAELQGLSWKQILAELRPLSELKESPDILERLERRHRKVAEQD